MPGVRRGIHGRSIVDPKPMGRRGPRYADPDASTFGARASACVSMYPRMFVRLPFRTVRIEFLHCCRALRSDRLAAI